MTGFEDETEEDEEDEDEEGEDMDETYAESRFPRWVPAHADVPVVPLRELPAGMEVYVCSLGERAALPSSWSRALTSFYGLLYLAVTCSVLVLPEVYMIMEPKVFSFGASRWHIGAPTLHRLLIDARRDLLRARTHCCF